MVEPPPSPRWLGPPPDRPPDGGWGVPAGWLRGLVLDRTPMALGTVALRYGAVGFRLDARLRLAGVEAPLLGGKLDLSVGSRTVHVTLPWLQVWPRRENGQLFVEVSAILIDRKF